MDEATLVFPLVSAVFVGLGMPLWVAMVKPNRIYGVHTAATLADESLWYAVNRATGRDIVVAGTLALAFSILLPEAGVGDVAYTLLMVGALAAAGALVVVVGMARVHRL